jgi:hypothetical protein
MKIGSRPLIQYSWLRKTVSGGLSLLLLFLFHNAIAQTQIQGIVNQYYPVTEIVYPKACIRVPDATGLAQDDRVMLIQMKGATINTDDNSSAFGDTVSLNNAGNYEIGTVCHVKDDSVFLVFMLLNTYSIAGKVQLVRIPQYDNAEVVDTLRPASWNNTSGTGGVLAIEVAQDLVLNAHVYADSSGFRGGEYRLSGDFCSNIAPAMAYAYNADVSDPTTQNGGFKGEAVAAFATSISGGRGAPANGGGGGNNHNNGGGGGANLSPGGMGGGNSSSTGCQTSIPGLGGKALSNYGGTKIFPGGGGGAGHVNNGIANAYGGGHGGGIVFIKATNLVSNNRRISANGRVGGRSSGDGASGGGGGGTIILDIDNYAGTLTVQANGGNGGAEDNGNINGRCYGSGGGGGGGAIYFSGSMPAATISVNGGNAGAETRRTAACAAAVPAAAGTAGQLIPDYTYISSLVLENSYCGVLLPINLVAFRATSVEETVHLNWEIAADEPGHCSIERSAEGRTWTAIGNMELEDRPSRYKFVDQQPQPGQNFYRLKITNRTGDISYSSILRIQRSKINNGLRVYPNPAQRKLVLSGQILSPYISLFDLSGKLIWEKAVPASASVIEINLPELPKGIYLLRSGAIMKKLVIR